MSDERVEAAGSEEDGGPDYIGLWVATGSILGMGICWALGFMAGFLLLAAVVISVVIWQACDPFAEAAQWIGTKLRVPGSVRGATLDAIASSMPELFSGIFFVYIALNLGGEDAVARGDASAEGYGSTIATCAGSAIYNMILIPAVCALAISFWRKDRPTIDVEPAVIKRDGFWFLGCELVLLIFLFQSSLPWWMALVFIAAYTVYILHLYRDARRYQREHAEAVARGEHDGDDDLPENASVLFGFAEVPLNHVTAWLVISVSTIVAAAACYCLVEVTYSTANLLDIPAFFVAVILAAAVSSVPDTFLSLGSARRGDDSGAVSNAFGSNIFDICICLSIPLLVSSYLRGWEPVPLVQDGKPLVGLVGLRMLLWVLSLVTLGILWHKHQVTRTKAFILCGLYLVFIAYAVLGSIGLIAV